ncbi:hypothetical protein [Pseudoalteromonas sp. SWYJ118]|uniref:hypothetical protein n=1 Tax=Pseudoalteromonas sp. SWYJ118 TaxID=2792062 RepID=UPI001E48011D|nr:hypothetical protein [Pseudoalteromonas sp. SWYJ118]
MLSQGFKDSTDLMGNGRSYSDYFFYEFDLNTQQTKEIPIKESNIWGMTGIFIFGVFNIKDE